MEWYTLMIWEDSKEQMKTCGRCIISRAYDISQSYKGWNGQAMENMISG